MYQRWVALRPAFDLRAICAAAVLGLCCAGCEQQAATDSPTTRHERGALGSIVELQAWPAAASEIYAADLNQDARQDIVLTSHAMNLVQPFLQGEDGSFRPLPHLEGVGFHPNGVTWYESAAGDGYLLQSAETLGEVRIYRLDNDAFSLVGTIPGPTPLQTLALQAPAWPRGLVVFGRGSPPPTLYGDFDPASATFGAREELLPPGEQKAQIIASPVLADPDADGVEELIFIDVLKRTLYSLVFLAESGKPELRVLYTAEGTFRPVLVAPHDVNNDRLPDLLVLGMASDPLRVLVNTGSNAFDARDIDIPDDFNQGVQVIQVDEGAFDVVLSRSESLLLLSFADGLTAAPGQRQIAKGSGVGGVAMASADFDADGAVDLALVSSGMRNIPPVILKGPISGHFDALKGYYEDADGFESRARQQRPNIPGL